MGPRVLVVDDEKEIRDLIVRYLQRDYFDAVPAEGGQEALDILEGQSFDLVVLDVMMPDLGGFEVLTRMRDAGQEIPVLFLTAKKSEGDIIQGLGMGADEYMTKPFSPAVLAARIKALLRLSGRTGETGSGRPDSDSAAAGPLKEGRFSWDRKRCRITKDGTPLNLTAREYTLLSFFISHPEQVFTKNQIHEGCWEETYYDDNTVTVYMRRLREKIEEDPSDPKHLITLRGLGYYFSPGEGE